jgi:hypothetical protein
MDQPKANAAFARSITLAICDELVAHGFTKFQKDQVDFPLSDGFHCWVGLNRGLYRDSVSYCPNVGIHHTILERFYYELRDHPKYKYNRGTATYAIPIGGLIPNYSEPVFYPDVDIGKEAKRCAQMYVDYGLPYARSISTWDALVPLLKERVPMMGGYPQSVACALFLQEKYEEALAFMTECEFEHSRHANLFIVEFTKLRAMISDKLKSETWTSKWIRQL